MSLLTTIETEPQDFIAEAATQATQLDLWQLSLLGVVTTPQGAAALIRKPDGAIARFVVGDWVGIWRLQGLTDTRAILTRAGQAVAIYLPGTDAEPALTTSPRPRARPVRA